MKKKLFITLSALLCAFMSAAFSADAQDARQRSVTTIVQDALALLPAKTEAELLPLVQDIASSAPESVEILGGMLVPADKGQNSKVEYAVNGVVNYAGSAAGAADRADICAGLVSAIGKCSDPANRSFLLSRLALIAGPDQIPVFVEYAGDPQYASEAVGALINIEGSDEAIMGLFEADAVSHPLLAYAAAEKGLEAAEPYLLSWMEALGGDADADSDATSASDTPDLAAYSHALALCGTEASMKALQKVSEDDYMILLGRLAVTNPKKAASAARKYLKNADSNVRCAALSVMATACGADVKDLLLSALKDGDREYRMTALDYAASYMEDAELCSKIAAMFPKLGTGAGIDVLNWAGANAVTALTDVVLSCIPAVDSESAASGAVSGDSVSPDLEQLAVAAIAAAGNIGGEQAADALVAQLGGSEACAKAAYKALLSFNGDIEPQISEALEAGSQSAVYAMKIASARRMVGLSPEIFALVDSGDGAVREAALKALPGVVTSADTEAIDALLAKADPAETGLLQKAFCSAISRLSADEKYDVAVGFAEKADDITRYYPVIAFTASADAVAMLDKEYAVNPEPAFKALLTVTDPAAADVLFRIAGEDASKKDAALSRFIDLVSASGKGDLYKVEKLDAALALAPSANVQKKAIYVLAGIPVRPAFGLVAGYLDDPQTAYAAAYAVKNIAAKTEDELDYYALTSALDKAKAVYAKGTSADDGYAVDEINMILSGLQPPAEKFVLPEDEAEAGYEVLFDGTDMSAWTGNLRNYSLVNGTIYVTANYGNGGNLYTKKEYGDFIFRFEFCFEKPGVNNGVGIRTPQDVDAAYYGMCECQILDHDDPIYKGLAEYQVHGSAYGIIPAKRIVHKPLGTWNQEEIKVVGDHITVTLNGEVILDGNLREACKGHNVAPDGGKTNPYTIDHRNHPGMFNKSGHISFCGHGAGIRFRNIRVLDLSK